MPNPVLILTIGAAIGAASLGLALLIGQGLRLADQPAPKPPEPDDLTAMVQPESWAPAEDDFTVLVPKFITAAMFDLDNELNRGQFEEWA